MNVEDIKKRNERRKILMKERENEYSLVREIEYNRLVEGSVDDNAYLLSIIEQAEKDLEGIEEIASRGSMDDFAYYQLARQALQAIRGN